MNQIELEKCKNDIIYFVEKYMNIELLDWQKNVLTHYNNGEIIFTGGQRSGKNIVIDSIRKHKELFR
jgi:spore cortex formation protein SpoVR/YcgB (stage V sporulation)